MTETSFVCNVDHSFRSIIHDEFLDNNSNPYHWAFIVCHFVAFLTFTVSSVTGNMSQVDKLWSILPTIYAWMCVVDSRTKLMALLSTLWSIRLSHNFYRRGGYTWPPWWGEEDYRWEYLRRGTLLSNKYIWVLFNIFFISLFQNYLLLYIASPSLIAWSVAMKEMRCKSGEEEYIVGYSLSLNILDGIATALFLVFLLFETMADNQQVKFQNEKRVWRASLGTNGGFANTIKVNSPNTSLSEIRDGFCKFQCPSSAVIFLVVVVPNVALCTVHAIPCPKVKRDFFLLSVNQHMLVNREFGFHTIYFQLRRGIQ